VDDAVGLFVVIAAFVLSVVACMIL